LEPEELPVLLLHLLLQQTDQIQYLETLRHLVVVEVVILMLERDLRQWEALVAAL
jgi:hypothetical protein